MSGNHGRASHDSFSLTSNSGACRASHMLYIVCTHALYALQKINHFNGMLEICRKKSMARNLAKMAKLFPGHYDFVPKTFLLPNDLQVGAGAMHACVHVSVRGVVSVYLASSRQQ